MYFFREKKLNFLISARSTRPTGLKSTATSSRSRCSAWYKRRRLRRGEKGKEKEGTRRKTEPEAKRRGGRISE